MQFLAVYAIVLGLDSRGIVMIHSFFGHFDRFCLRQLRWPISARFRLLIIADTGYRTSYSQAAHTTVFTVTTVFEPGAVITVGALSVIEPKRSNIGAIVGGVVGGMSRWPFLGHTYQRLITNRHRRTGTHIPFLLVLLATAQLQIQLCCNLRSWSTLRKTPC